MVRTFLQRKSLYRIFLFITSFESFHSLTLYLKIKITCIYFLIRALELINYLREKTSGIIHFVSSLLVFYKPNGHLFPQLYEKSFFNFAEQMVVQEALRQNNQNGWVIVPHPINIIKRACLRIYPIIFLLFTSRIIQISTTGRSIPLITCDHKEIAISGALGIRMIRTEKINIPV